MTEGDQMTSTQTHHGLLKSMQWVIESHLLLVVPVPAHYSQVFNLIFTKGDLGSPSDSISQNEPGSTSISCVIVAGFCPS